MTCSSESYFLKGLIAISNYVIWQLSRHDQTNFSNSSTSSLVRVSGRLNDFRSIMCPRLIALKICLGSSLICCAISRPVFPLSWRINTFWIFCKIENFPGPPLICWHRSLVSEEQREVKQNIIR